MNRGAGRALRGDLAGARGDLEYALAARPDIGVGWANLARVERALGNPAAADLAKQRAREITSRPPRGFPYGVGDGDLDYAGRDQRWLLELTGGPADARVVLYRPERVRNGPTSP